MAADAAFREGLQCTPEMIAEKQAELDAAEKSANSRSAGNRNMGAIRNRSPSLRYETVADNMKYIKIL